MNLFRLCFCLPAICMFFWMDPACGDSAQDTPEELLLVFEEVRPLDDPYAGHLYVRLHVQDGKVIRADAFADYNEKSENTVEVLAFSRKGTTYSGRLQVTVGPDGARRGRAHFPTPDDHFDLKFKAERKPGEQVEIRRDREAFMPPWRKDTPPLAGEKITGSYIGSWSWKENEEKRSGTLDGAWRSLHVSDGWRPEGPTVLAAADSGVELQAFLPLQHSVSHIASWAGKSFEDPQSATGGLRVTLGPLFPEASVDRLFFSAMVKTNRGWFTAMDRYPVSKFEASTLLVPFTEFGNRWRPFAGDQVEAVKIGIINGKGIGRVEVTIRDVQVVPNEEQAPVSEEPIQIVVHPEVVMSFNGVDTVQKGLFGFHDVNESNPRTPKPGEPDPVEYMRRLNPGYLRPLTHTTFEDEVEEVSDVFVDRAEAAGASDLVVWTHTMDLWARPPWLNEGLDSLAEKMEGYYKVLAENAWRPEHPDRVLRYLEVWNEPFMWGRHINMGFRLAEGDLEVRDPTQYGYIPGEVGADAWVRLFIAAAESGKSVNPHLKFGGPSVPDLTSYDYKDFLNYTLRIIRKAGDRLDFFTEHHYGGNPLAFSASYEVVRAAFWTHHQRTIPVINTEANDLGASDAGKAVYNVTEILNLINTQPDLVIGRALHANWNGYLRNKGELDAWTLMAPLRGKILDLAVDRDRLTAVATYTKDGHVVVVGVCHGFGDSRVTVSMPEGMRLLEATQLLTDTPSEELQIRDVDGASIEDIQEGKTLLVSISPEQQRGRVSFPLPERSAFRLIYKKEGFAPYRKRIQTLELLPLYLKHLHPGESLPVSLKNRDPDPDRLFLRLAYTGELTLVYDEGEIALPRGPGRTGEAELRTIEIPPAVLYANPTLVAGESGSTVLTVGWVTEE